MEAACCRADSAFYKMMARNTALFESAGTFDRMRRFLSEAPRRRAAYRLDAWLRIAAFSALRHEALAPHRGSRGVPSRLLTQAQLALSPACDLTCEGCYTAEDRGGKAPRREDIAFFVDQAAACGAFAIHVIGKGEPFLSRRWSNELLSVIEARPHLFFTVATHGMHIDDALAERMARIGNMVVLVAVDGPEAIHDARRGQGAYRRVHEVFARLSRHGVLFGYSCMVSKKSHVALTDPAFVRAQAAAGCAVGIYSRYFPLAADVVDELTLEPRDLARYTERFDDVRARLAIPLFDLDDVEKHTGCQSRAGESVYIDGVTGQVAPCLRVPFAPEDVRVCRETGEGLAAALSHPFFEAYRSKGGSCPTWCGANLDGELGEVGGLLDAHAARPARLDLYQARAVRRLPLLPRVSEP